MRSIEASKGKTYLLAIALRVKRMSDDVLVWIGELQQGKSIAAQKIWERYFDQLVRLAQRRMGSLPRRR